ncbi:MAG: hypothetical protein QM682_16305 [Paracoccus sp. (in: a-proteobacteria)]|uniref:hypothetical protein n=1 Tax=Paracoccus sp. TaxID=267 RepID=UPI0039E3E979
MTQSILLAAFVLILATLAACGVDGPPTRPDTPQPGLQISGEARAGVAGAL